MLHTALEVIAFNINSKNNNLKFFEFGKTYSTTGVGQYFEKIHLCLYLTGQSSLPHWKEKQKPGDIFYLKGVMQSILRSLGIAAEGLQPISTQELPSGLSLEVNGEKIAEIGKVNPALASRFDIKQPVFFADLQWDAILNLGGQPVRFKEIAKYPSVERDLAMVVPKNMKYGEIVSQISRLRLNKLQQVRLFDVFESEKLGSGKKSMAINLIFLDEEKTLTDKEIDGWMSKIMTTLEKELQAEIRK